MLRWTPRLDAQRDLAKVRQQKVCITGTDLKILPNIFSPEILLKVVPKYSKPENVYAGPVLALYIRSLKNVHCITSVFSATGIFDS